MADHTAIEWTDATWTPIRARNKATRKVGWHCEHASPGCQLCYSESFNEKRLGTGLPFKPGHRGDVEHFLDEAMLLTPLRWRRPRRIFVCSMTDLFGDWVEDAWIDRVFAVIALCPQHTFQVLTKRSARMRAYLVYPLATKRMSHAMARMPRPGLYNHAGAVIEARAEAIEKGFLWPLPNVWLGVSAEDQRRADERVPDLLATPAAVRFVSAEPLLGPIDFTRFEVPADTDREGRVTTHPKRINALTGSAGHHASPTIFYPNSHRVAHLDWIIVGGESGTGARPMHPAWPRQIRDACAAAGVAYHFKQWGAFAPQGRNAERWLWRPDGSCGPDPLPEGIGRHVKDGFSVSYRVGKKAAGRLLDGVEHNGMPEVHHG